MNGLGHAGDGEADTFSPVLAAVGTQSSRWNNKKINALNYRVSCLRLHCPRIHSKVNKLRRATGGGASEEEGEEMLIVRADNRVFQTDTGARVKDIRQSNAQVPAEQ